MNKYEWQDGMGEISGFGGGYEQTCRDMLKAGLEWQDANPNAAPEFHGFNGVYGLVVEDNDDAKALSKAILNASGGDCTWAMHQAVIGAIFFIRKNGWGRYVDEMKKQAAPSAG